MSRRAFALWLGIPGNGALPLRGIGIVAAHGTHGQRGRCFDTHHCDAADALPSGLAGRVCTFTVGALARFR